MCIDVPVHDAKTACLASGSHVFVYVRRFTPAIRTLAGVSVFVPTVRIIIVRLFGRGGWRVAPTLARITGPDRPDRAEGAKVPDIRHRISGDGLQRGRHLLPFFIGEQLVHINQDQQFALLTGHALDILGTLVIAHVGGRLNL